MVLTDTSIWIRFLANREPYAEGLDRLLDRDQVLRHDLVYGELLIGDRAGRRKLLAEFERIPAAVTVPHREVVEFVQYRKLHGRGIGWIDVHLLASAIVGQCQLWTADSRLAAIALEFGVAYSLLAPGKSIH
jgi:predicted nucleic acid-binding protein